MDRSIAVRSAIQAGILGIFIGIIPVLGIALTGALAVFFYQRKTKIVPATRVASRLGGAAAVVSFGINALFLVVRIFVFHAQQESADEFIKTAQRFGLNIADADIQASIQFLFTPAGLAFTFFFAMVFAVLLGSVGGALGAWFLRPAKTRG